ncbi:ABC transporter ATP-binding protein [Leuconostoc citreum]|uniref:ABC transporter ATP-binding protein n=1 Tax=Leuconostoc citreum TaxID=33964 RepID=UPI0032DEB5DC
MTTTILKTHDLSIKFGGVTAVDCVNIEAHDNELIGLIGPNGAGKTTLFNLLTGVYQPTHGTVSLFNGEKLAQVNHVSAYKRAQLGIARTFQNIRLFKTRTVIENVLIAMTNQTAAKTIHAIFRTPSFYQHEAKKRQHAMALLDIFNMAHVADELASNLPYGQQRRLEIVRALATNPKILFLDEPAAGMNPQETAALTALIKQIQQQFQLTIILIEHDMNLVMTVSQRVYVLEYGKILATGTPTEIQQNPAVIKAYLGYDMP